MEYNFASFNHWLSYLLVINSDKINADFPKNKYQQTKYVEE